jgi:ABC-2 type transport system permease protein
MKSTYKIAKLEFSQLFFSPIAWVLLIVFLFQCCFNYTLWIQGTVLGQELGYPNNMITSSLFAPHYSRSSGIFHELFDKLYLYLPLLTMGLISREISSGTIKLLYSSPLNVRSVVIGKFIAMLGYSLLLTMCLGIILVAAVINIQSADYGILLSGMLAMYLLLCAYSAIGLFMSCLTSYQVVAAISTLAVFAVLNSIGDLWQSIDFLRDITNYLSITGRTENIREGLVNSKDIIYFLVLIFMFLGFSIIKLQGDKKSINHLFQTFRYAIVSLIGLTLGYASSLPGWVWYYDATSAKVLTISANTQAVIKSMDKESLHITTYANLIDNTFTFQHPGRRNDDKRRWEKYLRFKPDINFSYVYYYDSALFYRNKSNPSRLEHINGMTLDQIASNDALAQKISIKKFLKPEQIRKSIDLRPEYNRGVIYLSFRNKKTFLRLYDDMMIFPSETEIAAAFKRLVTKPPRIAFLTGEQEKDINKMGDHQYRMVASEVTCREALVNQGYDVISISLKEQDIPNDIAGLVIAGPQVEFDSVVLKKLKKYIDEGGNMLIAGEPGKQIILNPLLQLFGVYMIPKRITQNNIDTASDFVLSDLTKNAKSLSLPLLNKLSYAKVSMPGCAGLQYVAKDSFITAPLLIAGNIITGLSVKRSSNGKEQRIVVLGDADCLSNIELDRRNPMTANTKFAIAAFGWLTNSEFPIDISHPEPKDNHVNLTGKQILPLKVLLLGVLPGLLIIASAVLLIKRKLR